jgi:hypothetical protein
MRIYFLFIFLVLNITFYAQNKTGELVTKNFKFADGIYSSHQALKSNKPSWLWEKMNASVVTNPQTFLTQVEYIKFQLNGNVLSLDSVWCVVLDGIPYIKLPDGAAKKSLTAFAGLVVRGKISYLAYEVTDSVQIPISAYNPYTGRPFMTKMMPQERNHVYEKLMLFETGEVVDFTYNQFKRMISDDKQLLSSVQDLKPKELKEKLFKTLLIYDDRNPIYIK